MQDELTRRRVAEAFNLPPSDMGLMPPAGPRADSRSSGDPSMGSPQGYPSGPGSLVPVYGGARDKVKAALPRDMHKEQRQRSRDQAAKVGRSLLLVS